MHISEDIVYIVLQYAFVKMSGCFSLVIHGLNSTLCCFGSVHIWMRSSFLNSFIFGAAISRSYPIHISKAGWVIRAGDSQFILTRSCCKIIKGWKSLFIHWFTTYSMALNLDSKTGILKPSETISDPIRPFFYVTLYVVSRKGREALQGVYG